MIVYLATYPRCGHAFLRELIQRNFGYFVANGYSEKAHEGTAYAEAFNRILAGVVRRFTITDLDENRVSYIGVGTGRPLAALKAPALERLTLEAREILAAEPNPYFVKTHEPPFDHYFPGESAIRMVRHPGAAILSHFKLRQALGRPSPPLPDFIATSTWSSYHQKWAEASLRQVVWSYEDAFQDQRPLVLAIGTLLGDPIIGGEPRDFPLAEAHASNPMRNPGAGP